MKDDNYELEEELPEEELDPFFNIPIRRYDEDRENAIEYERFRKRILRRRWRRFFDFFRIIP